MNKITNKEITDAIKVLKESSVKPTFGVIGWTPEGWVKVGFWEALRTRIKWFLYGRGKLDTIK